MIKGKYMIMAAVLGICTVNISGSCVMAAETQTSESDAYPDLGDSEEEQAYREFLEGGEYFSEVKDLGKVMYASYDVRVLTYREATENITGNMHTASQTKMEMTAKKHSPKLDGMSLKIHWKKSHFMICR